MSKISSLVLFIFLGLGAFAQTVDFNFSGTDSVFCTPSTIVFTQICTGNPRQLIWKFGNNNFGSQGVETQTYATPGTYTVKLTAIFDNTTLTISKSLLIQPTVNSTISYDRNYICQPGNINFSTTASQNGMVDYEWDFKDGTPTVNTAQNNSQHYFAQYGNYPVTLKVTTHSGCVASSSTVINVTKLPIYARVTPSGGCIPVLVKFSASANLPANSAVANYTFNYGDNSPSVTTANNTTNYVYKMVGQYLPAVTITTNEGCSNTYNYTPLAFGTPPANQFAYPKKAVICGSETAVFVSTATNANKYVWNFGDNSTTTTIDTIAYHKYKTVGNKIVTVTAYYNDCPSPPFVFNIKVVGVIAKYDFYNDCDKKNIYNFIDTSSGTQTNNIWSFGDGSYYENVLHPIHIFPQFGKYITMLKLTDTLTGCTDSISNTIYTARPSLVNHDVTVCRNSRVSFSIENNYASNSATYTWFVAGQQTGSIAAAAITVAASNFGNFNNYVIINNGKQACQDTINLNRIITVTGPVLKLNAVTAICLNNSFQVNNQSYPYLAADSIARWVWNYGDSSIHQANIFQPAAATYPYPGNYTIGLYATDKNGCMDSIKQNIAINALPILHVEPKKSFLCYGKADSLFAFHSDALVWSPNYQLSCVQCDTTIVSPRVNTTYYATATNYNNCSVQDSIKISVSIPFTAAVTPNNVIICDKELVQIVVTPKGKKAIWTPVGEFISGTGYNPVFSPRQTTHYTVTLSDTVGCLTNSSSATVQVRVKSLPIVNAGPNTTYPKGTAFNFKPTYSNNISTYLWTPAALLDCSTCAVPAGINLFSQLYLVQVTSDSGCVARDSVFIAIDCKNANVFMPTAFTPNDDNLNDVFYPMSVGIKTVSKFIIFNRMGQVVFEASNFLPNNKQFGWNGKYGGLKQPMGSYVYTLTMLCDSGETILSRGTVVLVR